jgi:hypothetical protein
VRFRTLVSLLASVAAALAAGAAPTRAAADCGLPSSRPVWIDYGEASVRPDVRAVLAKPGVVVASSGVPVPAAFRAAGAATAYFELHLDRLVGTPGDPADPAGVPAAADALYAKAVASSACPTPWIALNELQGSQLAMPWSTTNATYRADVLTLLQRLAALGAHPALLIHGNPTTAGDTAAWWRTAAESAQLVYEAYYDASRIYPLGALAGNRRMRLGMRFTVALFENAGVPRSRLGLMLGFHSALTPGIAGRQGLEPVDAWLRVVKWEALAARQVAVDDGLPTLWSWGWGTFGPDSVDPDKAAAACTWLWARDARLCDVSAFAGPGFAPSLVEGQIVMPKGALCTFADGRVWAREVTRLAAFTRDRHAALTAQFVRAALANVAPVGELAVRNAERRVVASVFHGKRAAYLRALARRGADVAIARGIIADELRRRAIAEELEDGSTVFDALAARLGAEVDSAICARDDLPGAGEPLAVSNTRNVASIPLAAKLPFLFGDRTAPAAPAAPTVTRSGQLAPLTWPSGREVDLAGYDVYRTVAGSPPQKLDTVALVGRTTLFDTASPPGSTYTLVAVDTSGNRSAASPASAPSS